jgi:NADH-quinone oxidoreductase subunit G
MVEIEGIPKVQASCTVPVRDGMVVLASSEKALAARNATMEFLLVNHPLDCPICDQAGECKLQEYSVEYGQFASRFVEPKVHKPKQVDLGPRIMLDDERCILCSRCIRFTRDIVGDDALGIVQRGSHSTLTAYPGRAFDNLYTLNTVDLCPVGALTSKDFRFQMRVWFLKETKSLCTGCATGCNILIGSREDRIYRYTPRDNDAVNRSWMCDPGRLNYKWIGREDRLRAVLRRASSTGTSGEPMPWTAALKEVAASLKSAAHGATAIVASSRQTNEELYLLAQLARELGATTDSVPRTGQADRLLILADKNPNSTGARLTGIAAEAAGSRLPAIADAIRAGRITTLVVFGEDVTRCGIGAELLGKLQTLVVCDILPNATTALAHYLLPGCAHAEKRGSFTNAHGRVQRFQKAAEPPGDARPEADILTEVLAALTGRTWPDNPPALFERMAGEVPGFAGLTWAKLGDAGATVPPPATGTAAAAAAASASDRPAATPALTQTGQRP